MKEIGMLFSGEMVQAILDERKTQTRRLARDCRIDSNGNAWQGKWNFGQDVWGKPHVNRWKKPCNVGDHIYVRETWSYYYFDSDTKKQFYYYKADYLDFEKGFTPDGWDSRPPAAGGDRWYPSIHMPKAAARIWLEVTDVRIERLQDISEKDAIAEGIDMESEFASLCIDLETAPYSNDLVRNSAAITVFKKLWESTCGSWDANPWVWVIEFKQIEVK